MHTAAIPNTFRERQWPSVGLYLILALFIPAITLVLTPLNSTIALPSAIGFYVLLTGTMSLASPATRVENGRLTAGRAQIPVEMLGDIEILGRGELRRAIGPGLDARSHLVIRGWIHDGVKIENIDAQDPAPYWILTSRKPEALAGAIQAARGH